MNLVDSIAALAGARCTSFTHDRKGPKTTFQVRGPTTAMHDLITRCQVAGTQHRLVGKTVRSVDPMNVEVTLTYLTMGVQES